MRIASLFCQTSFVALALILAATSAGNASEHLNETARSMLDGIVTNAPLVSDRADGKRRIQGASSGNAIASRGYRLAAAPGLEVFEDSYIRCVVRRALVYAMTTTEPSTAIADAATSLCEREREGLVTGYRLALWGVMDASVARVDDPAFSRAAKARVELIDRSISRIVAARIVHMRSMDTLSGAGRQQTTKPANVEQINSPLTSGMSLDWRIEAIVRRL